MDIVLHELGKRFSDQRVLEGLDLALGPGQIVTIIGLNGAGKTTLLRILAGVIVPSIGSITWDGCDSLRDTPAVHRHLMFLPDFPPFIETQTVLEHLVLLLRAYGRDDAVDDERIVALLRELDLLPHAETPVAQLSRGQRYKTALAALLLIRPEVWLLDEPFASGMDPQGMHLLKQHARQAANDGACVVYTTQILEIAERFCDELLVIDQGRVAQRFVQDELRTFPSEGPGSLGDRLAQFREKR